MKTLLLIRHAKSSWNLYVNDFERPLNNRGLADAPVMAERLIKKGVKIDFFVSSPAKRALSTASFFAEAYGIKPKNIFSVAPLYEPKINAFYNCIQGIDDRYNTVAVFSHNPEITQFANKLTSVKVDDMPTCAVFAVEADVKKWKEFSTIEKKFCFFDYPKSE